MAPKFNIWSLISCLFLMYIANSMYHLYKMYFPVLCHETVAGKTKCLNPALDPQKVNVQLRLFVTTSGYSHTINFEKDEIWRKNGMNLSTNFEEVVSFNIPQSTLRNGSLWLHAFLSPASSSAKDPRTSGWYIERKSLLSTFSYPMPETMNLLKTDQQLSQGGQMSKYEDEKPETHLRSIVPMLGIGEKLSFFWDGIPAEISHYLKLDTQRRYLPIFSIDELSYRTRDLVRASKLIPAPNSTPSKFNLTIKYAPTSVGKLRLLYTARQSTESLRSWGFTEKDVDEVKGIFTDTNFYFLALTFAVAAIHLLLDFLAFKNDINFWRKRKTMVGLSTKTLMWSCFSQTIVFFYLLDEKTSLLVLVPCGLGVLIELWKLTKAFKVQIVFTDQDGRRRFPRVVLGSASEKERETADFDSQGMHYLAYVLTPLCFGGAIYSLFYVPHRSWYSWAVQSMANAVYAFGFLFMLPQLFINWKLKSVAHLPWRAFAYKAFNTFIDDMFAFVINMPAAHRVACFRDDVVFVVYLYQRYLYPVDKSRINEFGESFEPDTKDKCTAVVKKKQ